MARQPEVFVRELDPTEAQRLSRLILRKLSAGIELALQRSTDSMSVLVGRCEDARRGRSRSVDSRMRAWHISPFTSLKSRKKLFDAIHVTMSASHFADLSDQRQRHRRRRPVVGRSSSALDVAGCATSGRNALGAFGPWA